MIQTHAEAGCVQAKQSIVGRYQAGKHEKSLIFIYPIVS